MPSNFYKMPGDPLRPPEAASFGPAPTTTTPIIGRTHQHHLL
jgi:hypothetical protein